MEGQPRNLQVEEEQAQDRFESSEAYLSTIKEETEEEARKRRISFNLQRLSLELDAKIAKKKEEPGEPVKVEEKHELAKVRPPTKLDGLHRRALEMRLRRRGIKHPERLIKLIKYLEKERIEQIYEHHTISKKGANAKIEKLKKPGHVFSDKSEHDKYVSAYFWLFRKYRFNLSDTQELAKLSEKTENPEQIYQDVDALGLEMREPTNLDRLSRIAEDPQATAFFHQLAQTGIKLKTDRYGGSRVWELNDGGLIHLAHNKSLKLPQTPEEIKKAQEVAKVTGKISVDDIPLFIESLGKEKWQEFLAHYDQKNEDQSWRQRAGRFKSLEALDKMGYLDITLEIYRSGFNVPDTIYDNRENFTGDVNLENIGPDFQRFLDETKILEFIRDPQLLETAQKISAAMDMQMVPSDIPRFRQLAAIPGSVAIVELLSELFGKQEYYENRPDIKDKWHYIPEFVERVSKREKVLEQIIEPDFLVFVNNLKDKTGFYFNLESIADWKDEPGSLVDLYNDQEARAFLETDIAKVILETSGGLATGQIKNYEKLAAIPNIETILKRLNELYGLKVSNIVSGTNATSNIEHIQTLSDDEKKRGELFSPEVKSFYDRLQQTYSFKLETYEMERLVEIANDKEIQSRLFDPDSVDFIKKILDLKDYNHPRLYSLIDALNVPVGNREILLKLQESFGYALHSHSYGNTSEKDALLTQLAQNPDVASSLLAPERVELIKRVFKDKIMSGMQFELKDIEILLSMPPDFADFLDELKTKPSIKVEFDYGRDKSEILKSLTDLSEKKTELFAFLDALSQAGFVFQYKTYNNEMLMYLLKYPPDKLLDSYKRISNLGYERRDKSFDLYDARAVTEVLDKRYEEEDFIELQRLVKKYLPEGALFFPQSLDSLIYIREHEEEVDRILAGLKQLGTDVNARGIFTMTDAIAFLNERNGLESIAKIQADFPGYIYTVDASGEIYNKKSKTNETSRIFDPYEQLFLKGANISQFLSKLAVSEQVPQEYITALYASLRYTKKDRGSDEDAARQAQFGQTLEKVALGIFSDESVRKRCGRFFSRPEVLNYLVEHPDETDRLLEFSSSLEQRERSHDYIIENINKVLAMSPEARDDLIAVTNKVDAFIPHYYGAHIYGQIVNRFLEMSGEQRDEFENVSSLVTRYLPDHLSVNLYLSTVDKLVGIPQEKREQYFEVLSSIERSPSQEIQRLKDELVQQVLALDEPREAYAKIERVFVENNIPLVGKIFRVFSILHPPEILDQELSSSYHLSPVLKQASERRRNHVIYRDLLKVHLFSGNRSLREYLETIRENEEILGSAEEEGIETLMPEQLQQLRYFVAELNTMYENSQLSKEDHVAPDDVRSLSPEQITQSINSLRRSLRVREGQTITDRLSEVFLRPIGIETFQEALMRMQEAKAEAHQRGLNVAREVRNGTFSIAPGSLLKGVEVEYIASILQNGSVAKEYLGAGYIRSDATPFDTDTSRVGQEESGHSVEDVINASLAGGYGNLLFGIRDRGQFQITEHEGTSRYSANQYELFPTGTAGEKHWGIRTGFPTTEIDFMIAKEGMVSDTREMEKLYFEIAQNGFYIPVLDTQGKLVFTPEMYASYRHTFDGLDRFDGDALSPVLAKEGDPTFDEVQRIVQEVQEDSEKVDALRGKIIDVVREVLATNDIVLKGPGDRGLLGAEIIDIGSTGRHTNQAGEYDFDLTLKLDDKDLLKLNTIVGQIMDRLRPEKNDSHDEPDRQYYQLRAIGSTTIAEKPIDIDIGIVKKSELSVFGSHDAVAEKLAHIERIEGPEARQSVIANIILAKQILKKGGAYKRVEHGGFGGIGTENWILANHGNMVEAFNSFWQAAHDSGSGQVKSFEEFKQGYKVLNPGMNVKRLFHDNYIRNLTEAGYNAMVNTIGEYKKTHNI